MIRMVFLFSIFTLVSCDGKEKDTKKTEGPAKIIARFEGPTGTGTHVEIPEGAAPKDTKVWLVPKSDSPFPFPAECVPVSIMRLEPDGLKFQRPVKVRFQLNPPASSADDLRVMSLNGKKWELTQVKASVTPDGKYADAWLGHFSDWSISKWLKGTETADPNEWDPNFMDKVMKMSLVGGFGKINKALDIVTQKGGPLSAEDLNEIYGTKSTEAFEVYESMKGYLKTANPAFFNFLAMMKLAQDPTQAKNWEKFTSPVVKDWFKENFIKNDEFLKKWEERYSTCKKQFDNIWPILKLALEKELGIKISLEELAAILEQQLEKYINKKKPVKPQDNIRRFGRFIHDLEKHLIYHGQKTDFKINYDPIPSGITSSKDLEEYGPKLAAQLEKELTVLIFAWESGKYQEVFSSDLYDLAEYLGNDLTGHPAPVIRDFLSALRSDLNTKYNWYAEGTAGDVLVYSNSTWKGYELPFIPFPSAAHVIDKKFVEKEERYIYTYGVTLPRTPLDATVRFVVDKKTYPEAFPPKSGWLLKLGLTDAPAGVTAILSRDKTKDSSTFSRDQQEELARLAKGSSWKTDIDHKESYNMNFQIKRSPENYKFTGSSGSVKITLEIAEKNKLPPLNVWKLVTVKVNPNNIKSEETSGHPDHNWYITNIAISRGSVTVHNRWTKGKTGPLEHDWKFSFTFGEPTALLRGGQKFDLTITAEAGGEKQNNFIGSEMSYWWKGFTAIQDGKGVRPGSERRINVGHGREKILSASGTFSFTTPPVTAGGKIEIVPFLGGKWPVVTYEYEPDYE